MGRLFAANLLYSMESEPVAPSRLRKAVDHEVHRKRTAKPTMYEKALMNKANSFPDFAAQVEPPAAPMDFSPQLPEELDVDAPQTSSGRLKMAATTRWYPHP